MFQYLATWASLKADKRAVTALEYGLIAAAIIVAISATVFSLGTSLNGEFQSISNCVSGTGCTAAAAG